MIFHRLPGFSALAVTVFTVTIFLTPLAAQTDSSTQATETDDEIVLQGIDAIRVAIDHAGNALAEGRFQESRDILETVIRAREFAGLPEGERIEALFILGQAFNALQLHEEATDVFRGILVHYPELVRVRLELARSLFLLREDAVADYHFRMALAGDLPELVQQNVHRYLQAIRNRRRWSLDFRATAVGNSNVNLAPTIRQIEMGPGVWILDRDARERSGYGISTQLFGEYRQPLEDDLLLRIGGFADHTHYSDTDFNDTIVGGHLGPHFILPERRTLTLLASGYQRWYGGHDLNYAIGPAIEFSMEPSERIRVAARLEHSFIQYDTATDYDGRLTSLLIRPLFILSPTSFVSTTLGIAYDRTEAEDLRNLQYRIGIGYQKDFSHGFTWGIQPDYRYVRYDHEWASFGTRREDHILTFRTNILNRKIDWFGFTPVLSYLYQNRESTIDLYEFDQHRFDFALTRQF